MIVVAYLANVYEATHKVLVAQSVDSSLCLVSRPVFNNSGMALACVFNWLGEGF